MELSIVHPIIAAALDNQKPDETGTTASADGRGFLRGFLTEVTGTDSRKLRLDEAHANSQTYVTVYPDPR